MVCFNFFCVRRDGRGSVGGGGLGGAPVYDRVTSFIGLLTTATYTGSYEEIPMVMMSLLELLCESM